MKNLKSFAGHWREAKRCGRPLISIFLSLFVSSVYGTPETAVVWQQHSEEGFAGLNELRDGKTGKTIGILACEVSKGLACFRPDGSLLWEAPMVPPVTAPPAVYDFGGDGREEIVACDGGKNVYLLDDSGKTLWTSQTRARVQAESCPAVSDLDGDGSPEIVVGDILGGVHCFNSEGKLLWVFVGEGDQMGPVLVADLYTTPGQEIVVTSHNGHVYALTASGDYLWDLYHPQEVLPGSTPALADVEGDGVPEIYIGGGLNHFLRIDPVAPSIVFDENVHLHINNAICAGDFDLDGQEEVIFGNKGGKVLCYGKEGIRWTREFHDTSLSSPPLVLNVDEDPDLEVLFFFQGTKILNPDGSVVAEFPSPSYNSAPLAGDFDGDGFLDVALAGNGLMSGSGLALYRWNVPYRDDTHQLTAYAGNRAHTGLVSKARGLAPIPMEQPGPTVYPVPVPADVLSPVGKISLFSGINRWRFDLRKYSGRSTLLTEIEYPDGKVARFVNHVESDRKRVSFDFQIDQPGRYRASQKLINPDLRDITISWPYLLPYSTSPSEEPGYQFEGIAGDIAYINNVLDETSRLVDEWGKTNPRAAIGFKEEFLSLSGQVMALQGAANTGAQSLSPDQLGRLREESERLRALATAGKTLAASGTFAVWPTGPWSYFHPVESLPSEDARIEKLSRNLCIGEFDSVALNVTNFSGRSLDIRVFADDLKSGAGIAPASLHLEMRRAVMVPTLRGEVVADALPTLDQGSLLPIASLESGQLWLTLNAKGLAPGTYTTTLHLKSVEPEETEVAIPIELALADLALPRPRPLRFCVWSYGKDWPEYLVQDLVEHGVTVHFGVNPAATCDSEGNLVGDIDFKDHDTTVKRFSPHGILLFIGSQNSLRGQPLLSEGWKKGYIAYLRAWVEHLQGLGLGYEGFALYPYDEPSTPHSQTTLNLVEVAKVIREADPNILIYTDPTSGTDRKTLEMFKGLIDIWCPSSELLERFGEEIVPFAREHGKETWFYDAAGRARTLSCLGIYQWRFWYAWNLGLTGAGWWAYKYDIDLWEGRSEGGDHYYHVYEAPGQVVTSKRWEAAREGIEDYELLYLWKEAIKQAENRGVAPEKLTESRETLEDLPKKIEETLRSAGRRLPLDPDGVPQYEQVTATLEEARLQIIGECLRLRSL